MMHTKEEFSILNRARGEGVGNRIPKFHIEKFQRGSKYKPTRGLVEQDSGRIRKGSTKRDRSSNPGNKRFLIPSITSPIQEIRKNR